MASYTVIATFNDGSGEYTFPLVQSISDPKEGSKAIIHEGTRANGSIHIPAGKRSQKITISGLLFDNDGFVDISTKMNALFSGVTTTPGTLTLKYWDPNLSGAGGYVNIWSYLVVRTEEIEINDNSEFRTESIGYSVEFTVLSY